MAVLSDSNGWVLETRSTAYALGINQSSMLVHRYWGEKLFSQADYPPPPNLPGWVSFNGPAQLNPEEYPAYGGPSYIDPCLKVTYHDGVRDAVLKFISAELIAGANPGLDIHLADTAYPLAVTLHYRIHEDHDLVERWASISNQGDQPVTIERAWSAQWHLPLGGSYRLSHLSGRWLDEWRLHREPLVQGLKVLESRRITTSHHANPWFAVDRGSADEDQGEVWFGVLAWSGNWKLSAEVTDFSSTRINLGINDWDFAWRLNPGETFTTPASLGGYTRGGFGAASRVLHDYTRDAVLPHGRTLHKILFNSWEATTFDVDVESQAKLARLAAAMGIELFVVDDGWFQSRNLDNAGLGDWRPDRTKFPDGLGPLINQVNALGMEFGLWIEPEMVNPDSDLYRAHPDWAIHFPTRQRTEMRHQLILNLARGDVQDYLIGILDKLLSENNIAFIKWDMNRNVSEPGWDGAPGDPRELWVRYVQGVYRVWDSLRSRHPKVIWQSCSGGGGRVDLGILRLADQAWVSDNTEATARLGIQEGFSQVFPPNTMEAWVTDSSPEHIPLEFRFHVSMAGSLGVGGHLVRWGEAARAEAAKYIALYKEIRSVVQLGDQYRLRSAQEHAFSAVQYVSKDRREGVLFAFRTHLPDPAILPPIYLRGLDPQALYNVEGFETPRSGLAWMSSGLQVQLQDFQSTLRRIRKIQ